MSTYQAELSYRKTSVEGASSIGLTIALYDTLAGDLKRAADAQRKGNIQTRCRELDHALFVIGYLETWIDPVNGADLAKNLGTFYRYLRAKIMEGQVWQSPEVLEEQIQLVLDVRGSWQHMDQSVQSVPGAPSVPSAPAPYEQRAEVQEPAGLHFRSLGSHADRAATRWSA